MVTPASKRRVVQDLKTKHHLSERRSCELVGISQNSYHYQAHPRDDAEIRSRRCELASHYPRYGYLLLWRLLRAEGWVVNKKRVYRIYKEEGLQVPKRKRNKLIRTRQPQTLPEQVNCRWSMDFVSDQLSTGRRFRILNVMDDYSRELIGQYVGYSIGSQQVIRLLEQLIAKRVVRAASSAITALSSPVKRCICDRRIAGSNFTLFNPASRYKMPW